MKKGFVKISMAIVVACTLLFTAACGSGTNSDTPSVTPAPEVKNKKPVTLTFTTLQTWNDDALKEIIKLYENQSGNKIDVQTFPDAQYENVLRVKLASGDAADVFQFHSNGTLLPGDTVESLDDSPWVSKLIFRQRYERPSDKKVITAPLGSSQVQGIVYNKEVFKKAGITSIPKTYTEFIAACEAIKKVGITPLYMNNKDPWNAQLYFLMAYSDVLATDKTLPDKLMHNKIKLEDVPGIAETNAKILGLKKYLNEDYMSSTQDMAMKAISTDQVGMWASLNSFHSNISKDYPDAISKLGMFPFTASDSAIHTLIAPSGFGNYVSASSKQKTEAKEFINFLMSDEAQKVYFEKKPGIPPFNGMTVQANSWEIEMLDYAKTMPIMNAWNNEYVFNMASGDLAKMYQDMFAGKDPVSAMKDWYNTLGPLNKAKNIEGW